MDQMALYAWDTKLAIVWMANVAIPGMAVVYIWPTGVDCDHLQATVSGSSSHWDDFIHLKYLRTGMKLRIMPYWTICSSQSAAHPHHHPLVYLFFVIVELHVCTTVWKQSNCHFPQFANACARGTPPIRLLRTPLPWQGLSRGVTNICCFSPSDWSLPHRMFCTEYLHYANYKPDIHV